MKKALYVAPEVSNIRAYPDTTMLGNSKYSGQVDAGGDGDDMGNAGDGDPDDIDAKRHSTNLWDKWEE